MMQPKQLSVLLVITSQRPNRHHVWLHVQGSTSPMKRALLKMLRSRVIQVRINQNPESRFAYKLVPARMSQRAHQQQRLNVSQEHFLRALVLWNVSMHQQEVS
jgi:hypothetical protein